MYSNNYKNQYLIFYRGREAIFGEIQMSELLDLTYEEYKSLLLSYGSDESCLFKNKIDAQKLVDYLNKTYLLMLKIVGKVS